MGRFEDCRILNIDINAKLPEIKKAYRKLCLINHPDKNFNLPNIEQIRREEHFKKIGQAYKNLIDPNIEDIIMNEFDVFYESFFTFASDVMKNHCFKHNITIRVDYVMIINNIKKKFKVKIPNFGEYTIYVDCSKFPKTVEIVHINENISYEIFITMKLTRKHDLYYHIINDDSSIDLVRTIKIDLYDSFTGFECEFKHLDGSIINERIEPFHNKPFRILGKGLLQGNLLLKFKINNSTKNIFNKITQEERYIFLNILKKLYKDKYY